MQYLPTPNQVAHLRYNVDLSGASYGVAFVWNERDGAWYFHLDGPSGDPVVRGVRVVLNTDLLRSVSGDDRPPYALWVIDPTGGVTEPDYVTISGPVRILYDEPDEEET